MDRGALDLRMARKIGADEPAIPWPLIFCVARRVDADKPAAGSNVSLKRAFLGRGEYVSGGVEEHDDFVSTQYSFGEARSVFGAVDRETMLGAQLRNGCDPLRDRVMPKARGLGKNQHREPGCGGLRRETAVGRGSEDQKGNQQQPVTSDPRQRVSALSLAVDSVPR